MLEAIEPLTELRVRNIEHNPRTRVMVTPEMVVFRPGSGAHSLPVAKEGVMSMAKFTGLPVEVAKQVSPGLFAALATELLERKRRYSVISDRGSIVDFGKATRAVTINPERVLRTIESTIPGTQFHRARLMSDHSVSLEVIGEERKPVVKGDLVQAGAMVAFSPIGTVQPLVQSYVLRLACINGAISMDVINEFKFAGDGDSIWQFFRQSVRQSYRAVDSIIAHWRNMIAQVVAPEDRAMLLEALLKQAKVGKYAGEAVRARALQEPPQNAYNLMNLLTWASSHLLESNEMARRTQVVAANFAQETAHRRVCPVCHRAR